jgi:hypothetical protein
MCIEESSPRPVLAPEEKKRANSLGPTEVDVDISPTQSSGSPRTVPSGGYAIRNKTLSRKDSMESKPSSFDTDTIDFDSVPQFGRSPDSGEKPSVTPRFRNWETCDRKRDIRTQNAPTVEDRSYRFWEVKMHKGQLDNLLDVAKKSWFLDKVAAVPQNLTLNQNRTFWEVKPINEVHVRARGSSVPARLSSRSAPVDSRPMSLRRELEMSDRSEEDILMSLYDLYFANPVLESGGRTVMVHDLLNKFALEDVIGVLDELGAETVEYIFLPLSEWETKKSKLREPRKARNKAYCFVHFGDVAACETFVARLGDYEFPNDVSSNVATRCKRMSASLAASQGVVRNLLRLMDLCNRKWHPRAGSLAIKIDGGLARVNVASFRKMLLQSRKARHNPALFAPEP